jgi:hypothetical protein
MRAIAPTVAWMKRSVIRDWALPENLLRRIGALLEREARETRDQAAAE